MKILPTLLTIALLSTLQSETFLVTLNDKHYKNSIVEKSVEDNSNNGDQNNNPTTYASCEEIYQADNSSVSGVFTINNGNDYDVYCHFENGGWTLVAAQFESNPIGWNEGIQGDYDPTLGTGQSFTLNSSELPSHSKVLFEKLDSLSAAGFNNFSEWFNYQYTTGDIALTSISSSAGTQYQIHRNINTYFGWHNPEEPSATNLHNEWENTLTVDLVGQRGLSYAFSPQQHLQGARGYSFNGIDYQNTLESSAWVIWVR